MHPILFAVGILGIFVLRYWWREAFWLALCAAILLVASHWLPDAQRPPACGYACKVERAGPPVDGMRQIADR